MARLVRSDVRELAATVGHPQFPAIYDQFDGVFTLIPSSDSNAAFEPSDTPPPPPVAIADPCAMALPLWQALDISPTAEALQAFIDTQGNCQVLRLLAEAKLASVVAAAATVPPAEPPPQPTPRDTTAESQGVVLFAAESQIRTLGTARLTPEAQEAFDNAFSAGSYFGAFTVSKDGGWGYYIGINTRQAARDLALSECVAAGLDCAVYAELLPVYYVDPGEGAITLAPEVAQVYTDTTTDLPFHAMAISEDGAYSKIWDAPSQAEAERQALAECENYRADVTPPRDMSCFLLPQPD
jgi:hypothetical protein